MLDSGIFDVGGVLHTYEDAPIKHDIIQTLGGNVEIISHALETLTPLLQLGQITEKEFWERIVAITGTTNSLPKESLWIREFKNRCTPQKEILEIVHKLKKNGYKLAALSNTIAPHINFLTHLGIYNDFDIKIFSNEVGLAKPDPKIYLLTLQKLHTHPSNTFYIDDSKNYVDAARKLGIKGILFQNAQILEQDLKKLGAKF